MTSVAGDRIISFLLQCAGRDGGQNAQGPRRCRRGPLWFTLRSAQRIRISHTPAERRRARTEMRRGGGEKLLAGKEVGSGPNVKKKEVCAWPEKKGKGQKHNQQT